MWACDRIMASIVLGLKGEVPVAVERFLARPLVQPAIEQDARPVGLQQVHRTGDGAHRTKNCSFM